MLRPQAKATGRRREARCGRRRSLEPGTKSKRPCAPRRGRGAHGPGRPRSSDASDLEDIPPRMSRIRTSRAAWRDSERFRRTVSGRALRHRKALSRVVSQTDPASLVFPPWIWPTGSRSSPGASASAASWRNSWRGAAPTWRWSIGSSRAEAEETAAAVRGLRPPRPGHAGRSGARTPARASWIRRWRRSAASTCW